MSRNGIDAKTTIFLKHVLSLENFYELQPFFEGEERWVFPSTNEAAQMAMNFLLAAQNWKSLEELAPLNGWMVYAPCAINCGPFVVRNGRVLFQNLNRLDEIAIDYQRVISRVHQV